MLLAVDVGNTDVTFGVFDGEKLAARFRFTVQVPRTSDEYGELLCNILEQKGYKPDDITEVIIASVVPKMMYSFTSGIIKYLDCHPIVVGAGTKTGIRIDTMNPKEIGPDRIVDAVSAFELYGGPIIVVDYGTATTYDLVTADGAFKGGVISPGIRISANALWNNTANLPEIEIKCPGNIIAKETISAMQAGLFYGTIGQTEYIIRKISSSFGLVYLPDCLPYLLPDGKNVSHGISLPRVCLSTHSSTLSERMGLCVPALPISSPFVRICFEMFLYALRHIFFDLYIPLRFACTSRLLLYSVRVGLSIVGCDNSCLRISRLNCESKSGTVC